MHFNDDGDLVAMRFDNWKVVFMEQRLPGTLGVWAEPFVPLRLPKLFNLRTDPYERADITSNTYYEWLIENGILRPMRAILADAVFRFLHFCHVFHEQLAVRAGKPLTHATDELAVLVQ